MEKVELSQGLDVVQLTHGHFYGNTSVGEQEYTLYGKSTITEMLRGLTFQISANSFFQTNTKQADVI